MCCTSTKAADHLGKYKYDCVPPQFSSQQANKQAALECLPAAVSSAGETNKEHLLKCNIPGTLCLSSIPIYLFLSSSIWSGCSSLSCSDSQRAASAQKRSSDFKPSVGLFKPVTPLPSRRKAILFLQPDLTRLSVSLPTFFECSPHCLANAVTSPLAVWVEVGLQKARRRKDRAAFCAAASQKTAVAHDFTTDDLMAAERRHSHSDVNTHALQEAHLIENDRENQHLVQECGLIFYNKILIFIFKSWELQKAPMFFLSDKFYFLSILAVNIS